MVTGSNIKSFIEKWKFLLILLLLFTLLFSYIICGSDRYAVIKDTEGQYFYAKRIIILGNSIISFSGRKYSFKKLIKMDPSDTDYSFSKHSLDDIEQIIFKDFIEEEDVNISKKYLGTYKIQLQGHRGYLRLYIKKNRLKGYVRFTTWGKRAHEYLKKVSIKNGKIFFIRSANSPKEINRLGANSYFTQKFSGKYSQNGKIIKGFMKNNRGERHIWDAKKK